MTLAQDDDVNTEQPVTEQQSSGNPNRLAIAGIGAMALCCGIPLLLTAVGAGAGAGAVGAVFGNAFVVVIGLAALITAVVLLARRNSRNKCRR